MIYHVPGIRDPIDQADIIDGCPIPSVVAFDIDGVRPPEIDVAMSRVIVLTQTCDLVNKKATWTSVASVLDAQASVDQGALKRDNIRGPLRAGQVFGWYFLLKSESLGLPEMIVNSAVNLHRSRSDLLEAIWLSGTAPRQAPLPLSRTPCQALRRYLQPYRTPRAL